VGLEETMGPTALPLAPVLCLFVVKSGGAAGTEVGPLVAELAALEEPWVVVHGGNQELDALSRRLGHEPRFVKSPSGHVSRYTHPETVGLIEMVYRGRVNNDLVTRLVANGVKAVGLSGVDGGLWRARRKESIRVVENGRKLLLRGDHTGRIEEVDTDLLDLLLANGYRPVLTLPALAEEGVAVNVDGDRAAAAVAGALGAEDLLILSNTRGLLRDPSDPDSLIASVPRDGIPEGERFAQGRFRKKLVAAQEALDAGVRRVVLATANTERPVEAARAGHGTVIS
jgi:[amino group carrier protein]-L-2-aminoadipate 6-kinase